MKQSFFVLVLAVLSSAPIFSQTTIQAKAKARLIEMHEVVVFTSEQKASVLLILEEFLEAREALDPDGYINVKEYQAARLTLALDARADIIALFNASQESLWEAYEIEKRAEFDAAQAQIDHAARYNTSTQEP